jgi:aerobic-type carbon monoxide dehydrogenase small subunit (CoxS/CutS family)
VRVTLRMRVNGQEREVGAGPTNRLLDVLRDGLGLLGSKRACGLGECGACTVLVDGRPVMSCITLVGRVSEVETIEGVAESPEGLALREAFADAGAFQCGFCTPGQVVRGVALVRAGVPEDEADLRHEISGNICRCTGYSAIVAAVQSAARSVGREGPVA